MAAVPVFVYAAIFVLVNIGYLAFECEALTAAETRGVSIRVRKIRRARSVLTLAIFLGSMLISLRFPLCGFGTGLLRLIRIPSPGSSQRGCCGRAPG